MLSSYPSGASGRYAPHTSYVIHSGSSPIIWYTCFKGFGDLSGDMPLYRLGPASNRNTG